VCIVSVYLVCRVPCAVCRVPCAVCRVPCAVCRVPSEQCSISPSFMSGLPCFALLVAGFEWVHDFEKGHAITAMEIYHGFLRKPYTPVHAFMYRRDPSFMDAITDPSERRIFSFDYPGDDTIRARRDKLLCVKRLTPCALSALSAVVRRGVSVFVCSWCIQLSILLAVWMCCVVSACAGKTWRPTSSAKHGTTSARMADWTRRRSLMSPTCRFGGLGVLGQSSCPLSSAPVCPLMSCTFHTHTPHTHTVGGACRLGALVVCAQCSVT
jgi:hypothetical protein